MKNRRSRRLGKLLGLGARGMRFRDRCNAGERGTCRHNDDGHFVDDELDVDVHVDHHDHDHDHEGRKAGCTPGFWKNNADKKGASQWTDPLRPN